MTRCSGRFVGGLLVAAGFLLLAPSGVGAQTFNSGSTGADGPFNPTTSTTLTLPPSGVFNFTTINIPSGVTVTFTRNAANTPVILLATGNVTINGTIDVNAQPAAAFGRPGRGGPGGFDGGAGADGVTTGGGGAGLGAGGGAGGSTAGSGGGGGGFGTAGTSGSGSGGVAGAAYGSPALRPILGGSGGGGGATVAASASGGGGGGGGGAILIASSTSIAVNSGSTIRADGTNGGDSCGQSANCGAGGGGSGGAIRLIAPTISGNGQLLARGGTYGYPYNAGTGASGRIRVEATTLTYTGVTTPVATSSFPQAVFPPAGQPNLSIASAGGITAPATPGGSFLAAPDILLPTGTTNPVAVALTASNIPLGTVIQVTATPQSGSKTTAVSSGLAGTVASSTATASINLSLAQTNVLTATATFPLVASAGNGPIYAEGEEVTHVRVAAVLGGASRVTYLTRSGREVAP
jgi:hypothetical protein